MKYVFAAIAIGLVAASALTFAPTRPAPVRLALAGVAASTPTTEPTPTPTPTPVPSPRWSPIPIPTAEPTPVLATPTPTPSPRWSPIPIPTATATPVLIPTATPCAWIAPSGGAVTLQGGIGGPYSTTQHSLPAPICVNFTGKVEYDRPFADSFAHPLRTLTGSQMVDRWVLANGTASWVLADFGYVRG